MNEIYNRFCTANNEIDNIIEIVMDKITRIAKQIYRFKPFKYTIMVEPELGKYILPTDVVKFTIPFKLPDFRGNKSDLKEYLHDQITAIILKYLQPRNVIFKIYTEGALDEDSYETVPKISNVSYSTDFYNAYLEFIKQVRLSNNNVNFDCDFDQYLCFKFRESKCYPNTIKLDMFPTLES